MASIAIAITNYGRTPAHDVTTWVGGIVREYPLTSEIIYEPEEVEEAKAKTKTVLHPGNVHSFRGRTPSTITQEVYSEIQTETKAIYLFGEIEYKDVFHVSFGGTTETRKTRSRYYWNGRPLEGGNLEFDREGNEAT
jgi:hypothetical protein